MSMALELVSIIYTNPIRVSYHCIRCYNRVIRWRSSVIRVGVAYMNIHVVVLRHLKEELSWAIDKRLQLIIYTVLFKTVTSLRI